MPPVARTWIARGCGDLDGRRNGGAPRERAARTGAMSRIETLATPLSFASRSRHVAGADDRDAVVQRDRRRYDAERADLRLELLRGREVRGRGSPWR